MHMYICIERTGRQEECERKSAREKRFEDLAKTQRERNFARTNTIAKEIDRE